MWQSVFEDVEDHGFTVLAVAMDQAESARRWIEAAQPGYPCLIDAQHHLADLYNLVNVPQAVWIDENGRIVRPPETAGSVDGFRAMDRTTFAMPQEAIDKTKQAKKQYMDALRDWARRGAASPYALDETHAAARLKVPPENVAEAHARFRLGLHLLRNGGEAEAEAVLGEAIRLHPDSWAMWRQVAKKDQRGLASGPEFWARVDALGSKPYYPPADLGGAN